MRSSPYHRILVLLDGTERAERVLMWVRHLARGAGDRIHLLTIAPAARAVAVGARPVAPMHVMPVLRGDELGGLLTEEDLLDLLATLLDEDAPGDDAGGPTPGATVPR
jgi:nucleotide-binding universal stress UspA family protein